MKKKKALIDEVYRLAKNEQPYYASKVVDALAALGVSPKKVEVVRHKAGIMYLTHSKSSPKFGVVREYEMHFTTVSVNGVCENKQYLGLSPYAYSCFSVKEPTYDGEVNRYEVLFKDEESNKWLYFNFNNGRQYGGLVVFADNGRLHVAPFFETERLEALALDVVKGWNGAGSHAWELPENFSVAPKDYLTMREEQTRLALKSVGLW